ncbi:MAG: LutB/LldF family L-lactate oxidation iron-sulfur protein [bacterium]|nr:LutB/LldF family L-lactate oxidation iron-sulfur protein [bacterium]
MSESHFHPERFPAAARAAVANEYLQRVLKKATHHSLGLRDEVVKDFPDTWETMRDAAHRIRHFAIDHLDEMLEQLTASCEQNGVVVHFARDTQEARNITLEILQQNHATKIVKSKSMTTEEIELNPFLEANGCEVVETDLGEYIVQLNNEPPSHITAPALHLSRQQIGKIFQDKLGIEYSEDPEELTLKARGILRNKFLHAEAGISGVNFACADTGRLVVVENEGNARLTTSLPKLHIAICGIEKVIPKEKFLAIFLRMLARSATGQRLSTYTNFLSHPSPNRAAGPQIMHLILLDNGRTKIMADPALRESLLCIRCGACLNVCPVYQRAGGHAYGSAYMGPIGAVLTPQFRGREIAQSLPFASSLCGACGEICPVKIPLPQQLWTLRSRIAEGDQLRPAFERVGMQQWRETVLNPARYERYGKLFRLCSRLGLTKILPGWTPQRSPLTPAPSSFRERWRKEKKQ